MANESGDFLVQAATYLGAAAIAVPIFNHFKLGSILGYLAAGVVAGPYALNLLHQEEGVFHIAEFGVVLFLFVVGLELSMPRLWALRRDIFGLGAAQMAVTGAVIAAIFMAAQVMPMGAAAIGGLSLAFSSTAFALQYLKDRGELNTAYGSRAFSVLLMQDLAVVPLLGAIPFAAAGAAQKLAENFDVDEGWASLGRAVFVVAAIIYGARFALNPILRQVASSGSREAFAASALLLVVTASAVAALCQKIPNAYILAVAHDRIHEIDLYKAGPDVVVRETLESGLLVARKTLSHLSFSDEIIDDFIEQFRKLDRERLLAQADYGPEAGREFMHRKFERAPGAD